MADVTPIPVVASIEAGPSTSGFVRGGRDLGWDVAVWRDEVTFDGGPCDSPDSYPNKSAACFDDSLVSDAFLAAADPKAEHELNTEGPFFPWTVVENLICNGSDIAKERHLVLSKRRLDQVRSSKFAQEISAGGMSGSPSFQSDGVSISNTAYSLTVALQRLLDARVVAEAPGPHIFHVPSVFQPLASALTLTGTEDYKIVFDNYAKIYDPTQPIVGGGNATVPGAGEAFVAVTGPYEYAFEPVGDPTVSRTLDARRANKLFIQAEQKLFYRFETCNVFLAKVTVYS
jgi:hypothetical protein